ncbi:MAG TPA: hypothetical protein VD866_15370 [Urbifossiella sp.]|nr:hypothetical protein [Urbifossiella sp.]
MSKISLTDPPCFRDRIAIRTPIRSQPGWDWETSDEVVTDARPFEGAWARKSRRERIDCYHWWRRYHRMCVRAAEKRKPEPAFPQ